MDENRDYNECLLEENNNNSKNNREMKCWIKFALLLLALFIACYLAAYYILDQMRHAYYIPSAPIENIDRIIKEQDKMFNEMSTFPMHKNALTPLKHPIETFKDTKLNAYKMIIDLAPFNNNEKNVNVDVQENRVNVSGLGEKSTKNSDRIYTYSQSFVLPEKIETDKVTRERIKNDYIITMPIDDDNLD